MEDSEMISQLDQQDIAVANAGDVGGFERIYFRYKDWVWHLAWRLAGGDDDIAADVCQEVFTWFYTRFPGFELSCRLKSYLYSAVRHTTIRHQQKKRRFSSSDMPEDMPDNSSPDTTGESSEFKSELSKLLADLTEFNREILLMKIVDGMTFAEIAVAMNNSESSVKTRYYRTISILKDNPAIKKLFEILAFFIAII